MEVYIHYLHSQILPGEKQVREAKPLGLGLMSERRRDDDDDNNEEDKQLLRRVRRGGGC